LLINAGLIVGGCRSAVGPAWCYATELTWEGHEFLDNIKVDSTWTKVKEISKPKSLELSVDVIRCAIHKHHFNFPSASSAR
jgi:hypothetical protein